MAKVNFLRCGMESVESMKFTLTAALISVYGAFSSGSFWKKQDIWGLAFEDAAATEEGVLMFDFPKGTLPKAASAIEQGDTLWLNTTTKVVSSTDGGSDVNVGTALEDAVEGDARVKASFKGRVV